LRSRAADALIELYLMGQAQAALVGEEQAA
jgi:hypothetical protein